MTRETYLEVFEATLNKMFEITRIKNQAYSGSDNAFDNFEAISRYSAGKFTALDGIFMRLSDKYQRFSNLLYRNSDPAGEYLQDTMLDLAVYAVIAVIYIEHIMLPVISEKSPNQRSQTKL